MTGQQVGVGFIGCGEIAHLHAAALRDLAADGLPVVPVAAADPNPAHREAVSRNFCFQRFYDTAEQLLADADVDAVWVGVPTALHREIYAQVLEAGKHLYAEKPIAADLATVRELADLAARSGLVTQVGFQSRFDPLLNRARDLVRSGAVGPVMSYLWRDDEGFPTTEIVRARSDWRSHRSSAGGGVLIEHSIRDPGGATRSSRSSATGWWSRRPTTPSCCRARDPPPNGSTGPRSSPPTWTSTA